eukprot:scaffold366498_cov50-Prasinocladus_malaysianus.AAC.1
MNLSCRRHDAYILAAVVSAIAATARHHHAPLSRLQPATIRAVRDDGVVPAIYIRERDKTYIRKGERR